MQANKLDHKSFLSSLSDEDQRALTAISNSKSAKHLGVHLLFLLATGTWITLQLPFWGLVLVPHGILLVFLFTLQHEAIHNTVFTSSRVNQTIASTIGILLLNPANWFRYFHLAHHRHTNDPDKDPELQGKKPNSVREYLIHVSGLPLWFSSAKTIVSNSFSNRYESYIPAKGQARVKREAQLHLILYVLIAASCIIVGQTLLLWLWLVPAALGQPFLRLYLMAEHGRCPPVANMFENTRTTFTNSLVRRIAWNMPYHSEHHTLPTVPFHNLPKLNGLVNSHLRSVSHGYSEFHRDSLKDFDRS